MAIRYEEDYLKDKWMNLGLGKSFSQNMENVSLRKGRVFRLKLLTQRNWKILSVSTREERSQNWQVSDLKWIRSTSLVWTMLRRPHTCLEARRGCLLAVTFWLISPRTALVPRVGATWPLPGAGRAWRFSWAGSQNMMESKALWIDGNARGEAQMRNWFSHIDHRISTKLSPTAPRDWTREERASKLLTSSIASFDNYLQISCQNQNEL